MVSDVNITSALSSAQQTNASAAGLAEDFTQFLTLLTVQLQNQDPLSPMDTTEFTNQLVAFTGVEQQINTNQKLDNLVSLGVGTAFSSAQNYVGQDISYVSSEISYDGTPRTVRYSLNGDALQAKMNIIDSTGKIVYSQEIDKTRGAHEIVWDGSADSGGKVLPGTYSIQIAAPDADGNNVDYTSVVSGKVRGVETQNGQIFLLVGERAVALNSVLNTNNGGISNSSLGNEALTNALNYVGMEVSYNYSEFRFDGSTSVPIDYVVASDAEDAKIEIYAPSGERIYSSDIAKSRGPHTFTWDGRTSANTIANQGNYTFVIKATDEKELPVATSSVAEGIVDGVETRKGQIYLNVGDGAVSLADVLTVNIAPPPST